MTDEDRQATPFMNCFDLEGVEQDDQKNLMAGIRGNENAKKDKGYKSVVATHGAAILGTIYPLTFECALRAAALLKRAEMLMPPEEFAEFLTSLASGKDIQALTKMVIENRTDYSGKSLVNPAVAGDVAVTGEVKPGMWAALKDPTSALKRKDLIAQKKAEKKWAKKEGAMKTLGFSDEEIAQKKAEFMEQEASTKDLADQKFDGNLEDGTAEEGEPQGTEKVKQAAVDGAADGAKKATSAAINGLTKLF